MKFKAKISRPAGLKAKLSGTQGLNARLSKKYDYSKAAYEGSYTVIPKVEQQVLGTADKHMTDDVTVKGIPYFETSNTSGGTTVYIAKEI